MSKVHIDILGLRAWTPVHAPGAGAVVYLMAGLCSSAGKWLAKRTVLSTNQVKVDMEVRFVQSTMTFDIDSLSNSHIRILCIERRFRKREIGHVLIDLSQYTIADRVDRWFKLCDEESGEKRGEVRLRVGFDDMKDVPLPAPVLTREATEDAPLSFDVGTHVFAHVKEINRLGEPCGWLNLEFVRGETDHSRQGCVFVRIKNVSPNNPNQKFSILCAEQIAVPDVGSKKQNFRSLNVLYEPQSLFVKLVVFQHKLSLLEDPVASATIVFEDEKYSLSWYPLYPRGHSNFVQQPQKVSNQLQEGESHSQGKLSESALAHLSNVVTADEMDFLGSNLAHQRPSEAFSGGKQMLARNSDVLSLIFVAFSLLMLLLLRQ